MSEPVPGAVLEEGETADDGEIEEGAVTDTAAPAQQGEEGGIENGHVDLSAGAGQEQEGGGGGGDDQQQPGGGDDDGVFDPDAEEGEIILEPDEAAAAKVGSEVFVGGKKTLVLPHSLLPQTPMSVYSPPPCPLSFSMKKKQGLRTRSPRQNYVNYLANVGKSWMFVS